MFFQYPVASTPGPKGSLILELAEPHFVVMRSEIALGTATTMTAQAVGRFQYVGLYDGCGPSVRSETSDI